MRRADGSCGERLQARTLGLERGDVRPPTANSRCAAWQRPGQGRTSSDVWALRRSPGEGGSAIEPGQTGLERGKHDLGPPVLEPPYAGQPPLQLD